MVRTWNKRLSCIRILALRFSSPKSTMNNTRLRFAGKPFVPRCAFSTPIRGKDNFRPTQEHGEEIRPIASTGATTGHKEPTLNAVLLVSVRFALVLCVLRRSPPITRTTQTQRRQLLHSDPRTTDTRDEGRLPLCKKSLKSILWCVYRSPSSDGNRLP